MNYNKQSLIISQIIFDWNLNKKINVDGERRVTLSAEKAKEWEKDMLKAASALQFLADQQASIARSSEKSAPTSRRSWWRFNRK